ncbi:uncharacterized protein LOC114849730 [Betta splendens]|uniref:Uncharacterized protein LOC114849730 n=1 Tax=Betta splendens TaxID=158456 RepID=A0A9W2X9X1_BETSP|nr:uncharacterized protein LOC114849730 [Betta splendens]
MEDFTHSRDQQRVLERKDHTIPLPCRQLHLTVSLIKSSDTPETTDQPTSRDSQKFLKTNTKALEKILKIDIYLMYYLRDNPKVYKLLEKQLSAIGCSVELDFNQEEAVVKGDIDKEPGQVAAAEKWEIKLDRVFIALTGSYVCHHVTQRTGLGSDDIRSTGPGGSADLNATLTNLTSDTLVLDGSGTQQYFQGTGRQDKELVERIYQVLIKEQQQGNSQSSATQLQ